MPDLYSCDNCAKTVNTDPYNAAIVDWLSVEVLGAVQRMGRPKNRKFCSDRCVGLFYTVARVAVDA